MTDAAALDILLHGRRIGTVEQFDAVWDLEKAHLPFSGEVVAAINKHRKQLAL